MTDARYEGLIETLRDCNCDVCSEAAAVIETLIVRLNTLNDQIETGDSRKALRPPQEP